MQSISISLTAWCQLGETSAQSSISAFRKAAKLALVGGQRCSPNLTVLKIAARLSFPALVIFPKFSLTQNRYEYDIVVTVRKQIKLSLLR
ncbi:MAG: hypothetical protein ABI417_03270 [Coleofasciculaceae cyanobacterium]